MVLPVVLVPVPVLVVVPVVVLVVAAPVGPLQQQQSCSCYSPSATRAVAPTHFAVQELRPGQQPPPVMPLGGTFRRQGVLHFHLWWSLPMMLQLQLPLPPRQQGQGRQLMIPVTHAQLQLQLKQGGVRQLTVRALPVRLVNRNRRLCDQALTGSAGG